MAYAIVTLAAGHCGDRTPIRRVYYAGQTARTSSAEALHILPGDGRGDLDWRPGDIATRLDANWWRGAITGPRLIEGD